MIFPPWIMQGSTFASRHMLGNEVFFVVILLHDYNLWFLLVTLLVNTITALFDLGKNTFWPARPGFESWHSEQGYLFQGKSNPRFDFSNITLPLWIFYHQPLNNIFKFVRGYDNCNFYGKKCTLNSVCFLSTSGALIVLEMGAHYL